MPTRGLEHPNRFRVVLTIWMVVFSVAVAYSIRDGRERQNEIQQSRYTSCVQTYEGVRSVFKPFFRPPDKQTPKEKADQRKFNRTINRLKRRCKVQVSPPPVPSPTTVTTGG